MLFWCAIQTFCQHVSVYCPRFDELFKSSFVDNNARGGNIPCESQGMLPPRALLSTALVFPSSKSFFFSLGILGFALVSVYFSI